MKGKPGLPRDNESVRARYETGVRLRAKGYTYSMIARMMGFSDGAGAYMLLTSSRYARQAAAGQQAQQQMEAA